MSEQVDTALRLASAQFESVSETARLDAELLLAYCLDKPRSYLYSWPEKDLSEDCWQQFLGLVERRLRPTPIAYLLGSREFYSMDFITSPAVLVPRPETELLVDLTLGLCPPERPTAILELGTGSGIIAVSLKKHRPQASLTASDIDPACLAVARQNAAQNKVEVEFIQSSWYDNIDLQHPFDLIVSNPPYIASDHPFLALGDLPAEPAIALSPGSTGLEALQPIIEGARKHLRAGGYLLLEHGYDQQMAVASLLAANGFADIRCELDANNLPRVSYARAARGFL